jgi:hypothetical protein
MQGLVLQLTRVGFLLLLWLFPVLREVSLPNPVAVLRSAGIGLAAAVTLPVAALIVCVTIIGIPLAVLTFLLGAIGLYFSKAVIAQIIGRSVLRVEDDAVSVLTRAEAALTQARVETGTGSSWAAAVETGG